MDPAIESHYGTGYERARLFRDGTPALEFVRSLELLDRLLPTPPARVLDVGGGPGIYAAPLARRGYRVHLVDAMPLHVEQARELAAAVATESRGLPGHRGVPGESLPQISTAGSDPAAGFTGTALYGVEGPCWPLQQGWADPRRREQILFAARAVET